MSLGTKSLAFAVLLSGVACSAGPTNEGIPLPDPVEAPKHVKVYFEKGMYGGWPANHGIWSWGDEILVGFSRGYYKDDGPRRHAIDRERPRANMLARSPDGGETWTVEDPGSRGFLLTDGGMLEGGAQGEQDIPPMRDCQEGIDFTHPDLALTARTNSTGSWSSTTSTTGIPDRSATLPRRSGARLQLRDLAIRALLVWSG